MKHRIGLRLEDKNAWERRVALTPAHVRELRAEGVEVWVERFDRRCFGDEDYVEAGARLVDDVRPCEVVLGIKEMPDGYFRPGGAYAFFSHTIKGQSFNMPMLAELMRKGCTLFDYELVTDGRGHRLVYFSLHAGVTGMIDTLWTLGQRWQVMGHESPFLGIEPAHRYRDLPDAEAALRRVAAQIEAGKLPRAQLPLVFGFTGSGNVAKGAQSIFEQLPFVDVAPEELEAWIAANHDLDDRVARVRFDHHHLVRPKRGDFDKAEYYEHPDRYEADFSRWLKHLSVLVHGIYWDERYPVLATAEDLRAVWSSEPAPRLVAVGDITCDVQGSLASTVRDTEPSEPVYVYDPLTGDDPDGFEGHGFAVMAVGNLPTELPIEASEDFSSAWKPFVPALASVDLRGSFEDAALPPEIRRATILWNGELTPSFRYLQEHVAPHR